MTVLTVPELLAAFKKEGITVKEMPGWRSNTSSGGFNPHGILNHHTAMNTIKVKAKAQLFILFHGRPGLDGPLCHFSIDRDGVLWCVGVKNANHAGLGDPAVLGAVIADREIPKATTSTVDGNPNFWGIEVQNDGLGEVYPVAQIQCLVKANVAIIRATNKKLPESDHWSEKSSIHHREWTPRKVDMSYRGPLRRLIKECLLSDPGVWYINTSPHLDTIIREANAAIAWSKLNGRADRVTVLQRIKELTQSIR